jgi:hypothetical protein
MVIIETSVFTRQIQNLLTDEEYAELQAGLVRRPDAGVIIPGSRGLRKLRWGAATDLSEERPRRFDSGSGAGAV